jgi:hypothetical protein
MYKQQFREFSRKYVENIRKYIDEKMVIVYIGHTVLNRPGCEIQNTN